MGNVRVGSKVVINSGGSKWFTKKCEGCAGTVKFVHGDGWFTVAVRGVGTVDLMRDEFVFLSSGRKLKVTGGQFMKLLRTKPRTINELASKFGVSRRTTRDRLNELIAAQKVELEGRVITGKRGQPAHVYRATVS